MSPDAKPTDRPAPSIFLSYASEDRAAAQVLRSALPAFGLEVWYDESDLHGGDAWDQKIRTQIRDCDFFMPVISANTERRAEGYFRREWRLAVERSLDMADDHVFLLPVVVDDTVQAGARVPERFLAVQGLRVPGGTPTPALEQVCRRLVSGQSTVQPAARRPRYQPAMGGAPLPPAGPLYRPFPKHEGGAFQFCLHVLGWALQSGWTLFRSWPKWIRVLIYVWLAILIVTRACSDEHGRHTAQDLDELREVAPNAIPAPPRPPDKTVPATPGPASSR